MAKKAVKKKKVTKSPFPAPAKKVGKNISMETKKFKIEIRGDNLNGLKLIKQLQDLENAYEKLQNKHQKLNETLESTKREVASFKHDSKYWQREYKASSKYAAKLQDQGREIRNLKDDLAVARRLKNDYNYYQPARTTANQLKATMTALTRALNGIDKLPTRLHTAIDKLESAEKKQGTGVAERAKTSKKAAKKTTKK